MFIFERLKVGGIRGFEVVVAVPAEHPNCLQGTGRAKSLLNEM